MEKNIVEQQFLLNRLANAAIDIYAMVTVLSRATNSLNTNAPSSAYEEKIVNIICQEASERVNQNLDVLKSDTKLSNFHTISQVADDVVNFGGPVQKNPLGL